MANTEIAMAVNSWSIIGKDIAKDTVKPITGSSMVTALSRL